MARNVLHVVTGLETGGAETMLVNLLAATDREKWSPTVVSLRDRGTLAGEIERAGVRVVTAELGRGWPSPVAWYRLWQHVRTQALPDLIVGWMYHGNIAASLARIALRRRVPVVWDIQYTPEDLAAEKAATDLLIRLGATFARGVSAIVYNAHVSAKRHAELGYVTSRPVVIPNGFDTEHFAPSAAARTRWRQRLGLSPDTLLIGRIGRFHAQKDYPSFLAAAALVLREHPSAHFALAGRGVDTRNGSLIRHIRALGIGHAVSLLGEVRPANDLTAALDVACSSSGYGEACPGILAEAMSCAVPCVTTDVGDSAWIVGETGKVVPPRDSHALAGALCALVGIGPAGRGHLGTAARARVVSLFAIGSIVRNYEELFAEVTA